MAKMDGNVAKRVLTWALLALLFVGSFLFFLFLTFPYEVLKESLAGQLSQSTGYIVSIGDMSAAFPLGLKAEKIKVETPTGNASLSLATMRVDISVLGFLLGKVGTSLSATEGPGRLDLGLDFGLLDLASQTVFPRRLTFEAKNFPLDDLVAFGLGVAAGSPTANPMVAPLLSAIGISAQMTGNADFKLDTKNPTQSTGQAEITLNKAVLKLSHPSLGLPDQQFKKALVKMKVEGGNLVVDKNSGFVADELELAMEGKVSLKPKPTDSILDLKIVFKLEKGLKDKFGFLIDAMTGSATSEGQLTMQVRGPMEQPAVTTF